MEWFVYWRYYETIIADSLFFIHSTIIFFHYLLLYRVFHVRIDVELNKFIFLKLIIVLNKIFKKKISFRGTIINNNTICYIFISGPKNVSNDIYIYIHILHCLKLFRDYLNLQASQCTRKSTVSDLWLNQLSQALYSKENIFIFVFLKRLITSTNIFVVFLFNLKCRQFYCDKAQFFRRFGLCGKSKSCRDIIWKYCRLC